MFLWATVYTAVCKARTFSVILQYTRFELYYLHLCLCEPAAISVLQSVAAFPCVIYLLLAWLRYYFFYMIAL